MDSKEFNNLATFIFSDKSRIYRMLLLYLYLTNSQIDEFSKDFDDFLYSSQLVSKELSHDALKLLYRSLYEVSLIMALPDPLNKLKRIEKIVTEPVFKMIIAIIPNIKFPDQVESFDLEVGLH